MDIDLNLQQLICQIIRLPHFMNRGECITFDYK